MPPVRRLAAILAADVAGYSRLMGADEEGTHERLKGHLRELVEPKIAEHRGRIVKNTGDGFLAEFASVVDAVRCAVEVQRGMAERNAGTLPEKRIEFRVGVNLGDVIAEEHDIFGDGVNVAARLEGLAEPGGICVSRMVRDNVRDKLDYAFEDLGEHQVKNIARPVRVYAPRLEALTTPPVSRAARISSVPQAARAPRLSIVVLPFANLSADPEQGYFADGITEDLTTDLSRIADMLVISRNSAFTYKDRPVSAKQIGRELGVRYVLEGSVRRSSNKVRVNAQLIDAETDMHLWVERFDRDTNDLFALQDEVTSRIAVALDLELIATESRRTIERGDTLDFILRGRAALSKGRARDIYAEAIGWFERALALDPASVAAQSHLTAQLAGRVLDQMTASGASDLARAKTLADRALTALPSDPLAHYAKGQVLRAQQRFEEAIPEYETAVALNRNWVHAIAALGWCKFMSGCVEELIPAQERAIRLSPRDPQIWLYYYWIGQAHLVQSHLDEAILWFEKAHSANPENPLPHAYLASTHALKGRTEAAVAELAQARWLSADDRYSTLARLRTMGPFGASRTRALFEATYFAGLRKAGMPEE
jgi:TolB-like protein/class 3 adenylate cyclase/Tfp pilus assembly protein PilF